MHDSEMAARSTKEDTAKVKPPSHIVLPRLSGASDSRTRRKNQDLLLRKIRRLRHRVEDLKNLDY
jgi:hypothetical protein